MNPTDSRNLVARFQAGDTAAFADIYRHYQPMIRGYVRSCLPAHADDITQDVFVKAWSALPRWQDQGKGLGSWLIVIAVNLVRSHARSAYTTRVTLGKVPDRADTAAGPDTAAADTIVREAVEKALATLPSEQRRAVTLYYLRGLSTDETARAMGRDTVTRQATTSLLFRARRALAAQLTGVADA